MLALDSPGWPELSHAYGSAADIPPLLTLLADVQAASENAEPWLSLWRALANQGNVYPATFAAVPHIVEALASWPQKADSSHFHFPAWVEICRVRGNVAIPLELRAPYFKALNRLPALAAAALSQSSEPGLLACALSAVAIACGQIAIAEAVLELVSPEEANTYLTWRSNR